MTVPILHKGKQIGALETRREGPYTRFEAHCAPLPGVRRLILYGGGRGASLGVMQPEGGELRLRRKLSRAAMRDFPSPAEYAGFEEKKSPAPTVRGTERAPSGGPFVFTDQGFRYLALPCALRRAVPGTRVREIGGAVYLLFRC